MAEATVDRPIKEIITSMMAVAAKPSAPAQFRRDLEKLCWAASIGAEIADGHERLANVTASSRDA